MPPMTIMVASNVLRLRGGVGVAKGARIAEGAGFRQFDLADRKVILVLSCSMAQLNLVRRAGGLTGLLLENGERVGTDDQRAGIGEAVWRGAAVSQYFVHGFGRRAHRHHRAEWVGEVDAARDFAGERDARQRRRRDSQRESGSAACCRIPILPWAKRFARS